MTTIKIPDNVHTELKVFIAMNKESISEFAGFAIMKELQNRGHKLVLPIKQKSKNKIIK